MKIGYIRCSTSEQNTIRQEVLMESLGVEKVFIDKASGKSTDRPALKEMLEFIREGDCVIVSEISRFARSTKDLLSLLDILQSKKVEFVSQKEKIDTNTPTGKFMLTVFGAVAELQRDYITVSRDEGIAIAKTIPGKYKGKQKIEVNEKQFAKVYKEWKQGLITAKHAMELLGLKPNTFYRRVKEYEEYIEKDTKK